MKIIAKKVSGKGLGHKVEDEYKTNKKVSLKSKMYSFAKIIWAVTLANEKKRKLHKMVKAKNNGLLVITDRYPQTIYPGCSDGPLLNKYQKSRGILKKISNWENKIYELAALNPPDLAVKLVVPTNVAIKRKPEMSEKEIKTKTEIINNLNIFGDSVTIDTTKNLNITSSEIMEKIWKMI